MDQFNPTAAQRAVVAKARALAQDSFRALVECGRELFDGQVKLPATNEEGKPVLHGANMALRNFEIAFRDAMGSLSWSLDRDWVDLVRMENRYVNSRFVTQEVFDSEFKHLVAEMVRLRAKLAQ